MCCFFATLMYVIVYPVHGFDWVWRSWQTSSHTAAGR